MIYPHVGDHRTSMRFSETEEDALRRICVSKGESISDFCTEAVADGKTQHNNTQRVRNAIIAYLLKQWPSG